MTSDYLASLLESLDYKEAAVLLYSYGVFGVARLTQVEMGKMFGMSQQRVSETKRAAIKELRRGMDI